MMAFSFIVRLFKLPLELESETLRILQTQDQSFRDISMGTLIGHLVPGLALTFLGLWHTMNTVSVYCHKGSSSFRIRFWYPFSSSFFIIRHLELLFILSFSLLAIVSQVLDLPYLRFALELDGFEHASIFLHAAIFAAFTIAAESTNSSEILSGISGILVSSVFGQELFLLHFHSADHSGLEGHYHWLLQLIVSVSLFATVAATLFPRSFPPALVLATTVVFQGCWFVNMGFMLWYPDFVPRGCVAQLGKSKSSMPLGAVICESPGAEMRARALANLQFSWILSAILMFTGFASLKSAAAARKSNQYEQLHIRATDAAVKC